MAQGTAQIEVGWREKGCEAIGCPTKDRYFFGWRKALSESIEQNWYRTEGLVRGSLPGREPTEPFAGACREGIMFVTLQIHRMSVDGELERGKCDKLTGKGQDRMKGKLSDLHP